MGCVNFGWMVGCEVLGGVCVKFPSKGGCDVFWGVKFEFWWGVKFGGETVVAPLWGCETFTARGCEVWWWSFSWSTLGV